MHMVHEDRDKRSTARWWRVVLYSLLAVMAVCTGIITQELSKRPQQETPFENWSKMPLIQNQPWVEAHRSTSPDGTIDAVLLERDKDAVMRLTSLRLVPKGEPIVEEPPYRHLTTFLRRVIRKSVFTATNATGIQISWEGTAQLLVSGETCDFFSQQTREEVKLKVDKVCVEIAYSIPKIRYKDKP